MIRVAFGAFVVSMVAAVALGHVSGVSTQEQYRLSVDQVIVAGDSESITALVSVLDAAGKPVPGLTTFHASIDGGPPVAPQSVEATLSEDVGIAVLLLVDVSGSMRGEPLAQAQAAASAFVDGLLPQDVTALLTFANQVLGDADFAASRGGLVSQIGALQAVEETGTVLYEAVAKGLEAAARAPLPRRAVVLLTDGQDSGAQSSYTSETALTAAASSGIPIYAVGVGADADVAFLQRLAQIASGAFYRAPAPADVPGIFDSISARLRGRYALTLALPAASSVERELAVGVELADTQLTGRATFSAPSAVRAQTSEDNEQSPWLALGAVVVASASVLAVVGVFVRRWRRKRRVPAAGPGGDLDVPVRPQSQRDMPNLLGKLMIVGGPMAGMTVALSSGPVDIGSAARCALQLESGNGAVAEVHARVWLQSGRLMLHHLARGRETLVGNRPVEWATLEPSDTLRIGPYVIAFLLEEVGGSA